MMPVPAGAVAQRHATGTEMAEAVMMQRAAFLERDADHRLLGSCRRLRDGFRHFARLAMAEADPALAVADDDECREAEALAALHRLRDAVDVDQLLDQLFAAIVAPAAAATVVARPPPRLSRPPPRLLPPPGPPRPRPRHAEVLGSAGAGACCFEAAAASRSG
jgi:hypothetical protein